VKGLRFRLALLAVSLGVLSACTSRPSLVRERFGIPVPSPVAPAPGATRILALPSPEVAAAFDRIAFVYRTGESTFETDPYAQLLASPRELLGEALRGHLQASGLFRDVGRHPGNADLVARVTVTELYGDFRRSEAPAAVLALRVTVAGPGKASELLLSMGYSRSVPIPARRPADLAAGIDRAVTEIAAALVEDLRAAANAP
jgi:hypothetical protein